MATKVLVFDYNDERMAFVASLIRNHFDGFDVQEMRINPRDDRTINIQRGNSVQILRPDSWLRPWKTHLQGDLATEKMHILVARRFCTRIKSISI